MEPEDLARRTFTFGLSVIRLLSGFPRTYVGDVVARQLVRAATSVGANYRAACRARSKREFVAKIGLVIEEADEALYWLQLTAHAGLIARPTLTCLTDEANQLVAILVATRRTAQGVVGRSIANR